MFGPVNMSVIEHRMSGLPFPALQSVRKTAASRPCPAVVLRRPAPVALGALMRTLSRLARLLVVAVVGLFFLVTPARAHDGPAMGPLEVEDLEGLFAEPVPPPEGWRTVPGLYTRIHTHPDDLGTARALTDHADASVPELARSLGFPPGATIEIFLAPDTETFRSMQPGRPPDWADGTAWPNRHMAELGPIMPAAARREASKGLLAVSRRSDCSLSTPCAEAHPRTSSSRASHTASFGRHQLAHVSVA